MEKNNLKQIPGLGGKYSVSRDGEVFGPRGRLKQKIKAEGYKWITLRYNGKVRNLYIHRLVAEAFIPNPENKPQVNHIDGDKSNNRVSNLEWADASENGIHKFYILGKMRGSYPIKRVYCVELERTFKSVGEAGRDLKISTNCIAKVARGNTPNKTAGGYHWKYIT